MKLEVQRDIFMKGINECSSIIAALKSTKDDGHLLKLHAIAGSLKFEMVYGNGSARATIDADVATPGELLISTDMLVRTSWSHDKLTLQTTDSNQLGFKCGRLKGNYDLSASKKEFESLRPVVPKSLTQFKIDADTLKEALAYVRYEPSLAQDANPSVEVTLTNKKTIIKSTDTYGGAHSELKASNGDIDGEVKFIIAASVLDPALEPFSGIIKARQSKKTLTLSTKTFESHVPLSRAMVGDIREWLNTHVTMKPHCIIEVVAKEFLDALNSVRTLTKDDKSQVIVDITPNGNKSTIQLHTATKGLGELTTNLQVTTLKTKNKQFAVGASLFNKFFKCFGNKTPVILKVYDKVVHIVIDHADYLFPTNIK